MVIVQYRLPILLKSQLNRLASFCQNLPLGPRVLTSKRQHLDQFRYRYHRKSTNAGEELWTNPAEARRVGLSMVFALRSLRVSIIKSKKNFLTFLSGIKMRRFLSTANCCWVFGLIFVLLGGLVVIASQKKVQLESSWLLVTCTCLPWNINICQWNPPFVRVKSWVLQLKQVRHDIFQERYN